MLTTTPVAPVVTTATPPPPSTGSKVKLPKLTLKSFDGDITAFWDSFKAGIHDNPTLSDIDTFNYLRGLLQRIALDSISGLSLTAANYREAITIRGFETSNRSCPNIWTLINLEAVTSAHNVKGLCRVYDTV